MVGIVVAAVANRAGCIDKLRQPEYDLSGLYILIELVFTGFINRYVYSCSTLTSF